MKACVTRVTSCIHTKSSRSGQAPHWWHPKCSIPSRRSATRWWSWSQDTSTGLDSSHRRSGGLPKRQRSSLGTRITFWWMTYPMSLCAFGVCRWVETKNQGLKNDLTNVQKVDFHFDFSTFDIYKAQKMNHEFKKKNYIKVKSKCNII
jgi:hypothetical protein